MKDILIIFQIQNMRRIYMKIMAPYENGIDYFLKTENSENIFLYAVPF